MCIHLMLFLFDHVNVIDQDLMLSMMNVYFIFIFLGSGVGLKFLGNFCVGVREYEGGLVISIIFFICF
jgi:hypothetical protein